MDGISRRHTEEKIFAVKPGKSDRRSRDDIKMEVKK
jgi:hypothetical protein